jgi:hypothetical protein
VCPKLFFSTCELVTTLQYDLIILCFMETFRYMTEVRRLNLPQSQTEHVYRGFCELEEKLLSPY